LEVSDAVREYVKKPAVKVPPVMRKNRTVINVTKLLQGRQTDLERIRSWFGDVISIKERPTGTEKPRPIPHSL